MLKDRGYKVRPVPSGKLALLAAERDPPDLILLDINMPEMNGYEVCEHLKADDTLKGIPVIFISALTEQPGQGEGVCHRRGGLHHQAVSNGRIARARRDAPEAPPPANRIGGDQRATGEGQRPDVPRPEGGGKDPGDVPAPRGTSRPGHGLRLDLPALRRTGRRWPERHPARRWQGRALHPGRQRPWRRVGPVVGDAEPSPLAAVGAVLDSDPRSETFADRLDITPPAEVAARLNRLFPFDPATEQFATMVYGILNAATGEFRYVSAGHPGPVHLPFGADPVILESHGFPIGLADDAYEERSVRLGAGDRLYLYSDGVPEAMDPAGKQFGDARLLEAIGQGRSEPLQESVATLLRNVAQWHGCGQISRRYLHPGGRAIGRERHQAIIPLTTLP